MVLSLLPTDIKGTGLLELWSKIQHSVLMIVFFIRQSVVVTVFVVPGKPTGYDRVRNAEIGNKDFELDVLEEAYTTEHWLVRIYKVKDLENRGV